MREFIRLIENTSGDYREGSTWLHGGPKLTGHFMRGGRGGRDMGGIFFAPDTDDGWEYAARYVVMRSMGREGGIYRCRCTLDVDDVMDYAREEHRERLRAVVPAADMEKLEASIENSQLGWMKTPAGQVAMEGWLNSAGFAATLISERPSIVSLCVFDPNCIVIVDFTTKEEVLRSFK